MWVAEWKEVVFTDEPRICLQHHDGRIRVWRHLGEKMLNRCVMHRHTGPVPDIIVLRQSSDGIPWAARSPDLWPIENMWPMVAQRLTHITSPAATPDQLSHRVEAARSGEHAGHYIRCIVSASSMFSTRRALCGRALSSWKTKESPMATASVRPPMLIPPHTIQPALLYCDLSRTNAGLFRVPLSLPYKNTSGVTL
ncbi:transposable element Tcb1 transposase [Trichonephila clavipes]|nr:transposable element Tcb1 transposase [Trichonephila clavipes]